ncbi:hypothetical protein NOCARDAX2BIS_380053 [Nocardioides sp. AX2bis]|nr:hypothetical protein NOCARDAX2BIS_380053 [Nocardioides sp. AX2bis]
MFPGPHDLMTCGGSGRDEQEPTSTVPGVLHGGGAVRLRHGRDGVAWRRVADPGGALRRARLRHRADPAHPARRVPAAGVRAGRRALGGARRGRRGVGRRHHGHHGRFAGRG